MTELEPRVRLGLSDAQVNELQLKLRRLERRDWWLWWAAIVVMLLLTAGVVSLSFPAWIRLDDITFWEYQFNLTQAVRGLVGLVLLFNAYTIYQQVQIKGLRRQLAEQIDIMARLEIRAEELHRLAVLDPLTGLYNRRVADERLAAEVARSERRGYPLTVLALDLNDFKLINDRHGHAAGDKVLKEFAGQLKKEIRVSDMAVRMGGDEFMVVLPECPPENVYHLLERLGRVRVRFRGVELAVTFSAGWAGYEKGDTPARLVERADQALYTDKRNKAASRGVPAAR